MSQMVRGIVFGIAGTQQPSRGAANIRGRGRRPAGMLSFTSFHTSSVGSTWRLHTYACLLMPEACQARLHFMGMLEFGLICVIHDDC